MRSLFLPISLGDFCLASRGIGEALNELLNRHNYLSILMRNLNGTNPNRTIDKSEMHPKMNSKQIQNIFQNIRSPKHIRKSSHNNFHEFLKYEVSYTYLHSGSMKKIQFMQLEMIIFRACIDAYMYK